MSYLSQKSVDILNRLAIELASDKHEPDYGNRILHYVHKSFSNDYCHYASLSPEGKTIYRDTLGEWNHELYYAPREEYDFIKKAFVSMKTEFGYGRLDSKTHKIMSAVNPLNELIYRYIPHLDILGCIHRSNLAVISIKFDKKGHSGEQETLFNIISPFLLKGYIDHARIKKNTDIQAEDGETCVFTDADLNILSYKNDFLRKLSTAGLSWIEFKNRIYDLICYDTFFNSVPEKEIKVSVNHSVLIRKFMNMGSFVYQIILRERKNASLLFTKREIQVVNLVREGFTNKMIADKLGISSETVKKHVSNLLVKTGAMNRVGLSQIKLL